MMKIAAGFFFASLLLPVVAFADAADDDWVDDDTSYTYTCDDLCSVATDCETPCIVGDCVQFCLASLPISDIEDSCIEFSSCSAFNDCVCAYVSDDDDTSMDDDDTPVQDDDAADDDADDETDDDESGGVSDDDSAADMNVDDDDNDNNDNGGCSVASDADKVALPFGMFAIGLLAFIYSARKTKR